MLRTRTNYLGTTLWYYNFLHQVDTQVLNLIHIWYLGTAVPRYPVLLLLPLLLFFSIVTFFVFFERYRWPGEAFLGWEHLQM
jgi:hypothetical protein